METARGTSQQNRDYISKSGKWEADKKHGTKITGTFEEWGDIPQEQPGARTDLAELYALIKAGASNYEIMELEPKYMMYLERIDRARQTVRAEDYRETFRQLEVTYIWGPTGTGKTRGVMEQYGYEKVCRVTDYDHAFEGYRGEDVIVFDEYRSQFKIHDILNYLDGYPITLPCRYANRQACYTKVYIISNVPLKEQYSTIKVEQPATWAAFRRRIHKVIEYTAEGCNNEPPAPIIEAVPTQQDLFTELDDHEPIPF